MNNKKPQIYCYTHPDYPGHDGCCKIGYTEGDAHKRIHEQHITADIRFNIEWVVPIKGFTDKNFHSYLSFMGIPRLKSDSTGRETEWFKINPIRARELLLDYLRLVAHKPPVELRDEQIAAINKTFEYISSDDSHSTYLWSAKPRFGKTVVAYQFCKEYGAKKILIITNRPAIATSWEDEFNRFGFHDHGYTFINNTEIKTKSLKTLPEKAVCFLSLQNLKGSKHLSDGKHDKLKEIADTYWDVVLLDEAHEGVDTYKTSTVLSKLQRDVTLHLTGTAFKSILKEEFHNAVYSWTYVDEQRAKNSWTGSEANPYADLPRISLTAYKLQNIIGTKSDAEIGSDDYIEYGYDTNNLFKIDDVGNFIHESEVDLFLNSISSDDKYPYGPSNRNKAKHAFWLLPNRTAIADTLLKKLKDHPIFKDYSVISVAGKGGDTNSDDEFNPKETADMLKKVKENIKDHEKTITLSVGRLTTGVTVPEWDSVLILSDVESRERYIQTIFRIQNPYTRPDGTRKDIAYVYDFNQRNALTIMESFANDLSIDSSAGQASAIRLEKRRENVQALLDCLDIYGESNTGSITKLTRDDVINIPVEANADRVIRSKFMCNDLFENIDRLFCAPKEVLNILNAVECQKKNPVGTEIIKKSKEFKKKLLSSKIDISLAEKAQVSIYTNIDDDIKFYINIILTNLKSKLSEKSDNYDPKEIAKMLEPLIRDKLSKKYSKFENTKRTCSESISKKYEEEIRRVEEACEKSKAELSRFLFNRSKKIAELEMRRDAEIEHLKAQREEENKAEIARITNDFYVNRCSTIESTITDIYEKLSDLLAIKEAKSGTEDEIREHMKGFARTIPSFIMAYGLNGTLMELGNLETLIPSKVFKEVTSISIEEFKLLRDGGTILNSDGTPVLDAEGNPKVFGGGVFNELIFNEAIKKFTKLYEDLADYFEDDKHVDIFDYIPLQKTNQCFTPKEIIVKMVDALDVNSPGCFSDPSKTFIDLHMKSGMFITEIIKRLYKNTKHLYESDAECLRHILENQVYGIAPTEIIYNIALNYIFSSKKMQGLSKNNFKLLNYDEKNIQHSSELIVSEIEKLFS